MYTTPTGHERTAGNTHGAIFSEGETSFLFFSFSFLTGSLKSNCFDEL